MKRFYLAFVVSLALAASASAVLAAGTGVPSAGNCVAPPIIVVSPDGTIATDVLVRDLANNPISSSFVSLVFDACTGFNLCPNTCASCTVVPGNRTINMFTNAAGHATFDLHMGASGCSSAPVVRMYADGVWLGVAVLAPLDRDGDLAVTAADVAAVQALVGTNDPSANFDVADFFVTDTDVAIVAAHLGSTCSGPVPARPRTWGALKSIYR